MPEASSSNRGEPLLEMIEQDKVDTTFLISHHASLEDDAEMYRHWHEEQNDYTKNVLKTEMAKGAIEKREEESVPA